jgi:hypothetical protein
LSVGRKLDRKRGDVFDEFATHLGDSLTAAVDAGDSERLGMQTLTKFGRDGDCSGDNIVIGHKAVEIPGVHCPGAVVDGGVIHGFGELGDAE